MIVSDLYNRFAVCHMIASQQAPELHWCVHIRTISHIFWWINMLNMDIKLQNLTAKWPVIWPTIISESLLQKTQQSPPWLLDIHQIFILIYCLEWQVYFLHNGSSHFSSRLYLTRIKGAKTSLFSGLIFDLKLHYSTILMLGLEKARAPPILYLRKFSHDKGPSLKFGKREHRSCSQRQALLWKKNWSVWN